ncbi:MAG TPA: ABC transporter ATP-binding protein [Chthoniobacteraceae bacterium]|jgi:lipopolysaccharide transport system ATP-binding protein
MSSELAISVRGVGKTFQIATAEHRATTLAEMVASKLRKPFTRKKRSAAFEALRDVSFEVHTGEVLGIIGRNGAGKSTLLKILSQITPPSHGEVDLYGRVGCLLEVGAGFHPELTGRENIYLNGTLLGMERGEIDRQFDSIVAFAETEQFLDTPVKRYSSGMYVRLAFAVAAHLRPDILIVDEVLAVGDLAFQRKCLGKMDEVAHRSGATVIFVSHQMSAVRTLCTRALLLDKGTVAAQGEVESVLNAYLALNSAALSASSELPPGLPDAPAHGTCIRTFSAEGAVSATFRLGEPWRVRLEFEVLRAVPHVIAAVGICNSESLPITTWWSASSDLQPGKYSVEFECDLPIAATELNFNVGISTNEKTVYYADRVGSVEVSEIAYATQPLRPSGCGFVFTTSRPEIRPSGER